MKVKKLILRYAISLAIPLLLGMTPAVKDIPYGTIQPEKYLTGRFQPRESDMFVEISTMGIPTRGKKLYMRREAASAVVVMYADMKKALPEAVFYIRSTTRTFSDQKAIWEDKWFGRVLVGGKRLDREYRDPDIRAERILEYSSMPGTSRHHWGTDFDINELNNRYYEEGGLAVYTWMCNNAHRYGFCRPYNEGRQKGYREEKWHWSYIPLARRFQSDWIEMYGSNPECIAAKGLFAGSESAGKMALTYVASVNTDCD